MGTQTNPVRWKANTKSATGVKALIMAASVAMTLGGWGILAVGQINDAQASVPASPAATQVTSPSTTTSTQASSPTTTSSNSSTSISSLITSSSLNPVARTRSSS